MSSLEKFVLRYGWIKLYKGVGLDTGEQGKRVGYRRTREEGWIQENKGEGLDTGEQGRRVGYRRTRE